MAGRNYICNKLIIKIFRKSYCFQNKLSMVDAGILNIKKEVLKKY